MTHRYHPNAFIDPLYGTFRLEDVLYQLSLQPEIQRLRHIRLSNIDSYTMPGIAGITRFEHSLGTAVLAERAAASIGLNTRDHLILTMAALLHDVAITPFGHLMEEGFHYAGLIFNHESAFREILAGQRGYGNVNVQVFRGRTAGLPKILALRQVREHDITYEDVLNVSAGQGALGRLIAGKVDLDNLDNVSRIAYHMGLPFRLGLPLDIAECYFLRGDVLCFDRSQVDLLTEWLDLRSRVYMYLMTNPDDFVAKAMIVEAVRRGLTSQGQAAEALAPEDWRLTDDELLDRLGRFAPTADLVDRLLAGDLYELVGLYWIDSAHIPTELLAPQESASLRLQLTELMGLPRGSVITYSIRDKRVRLIDDLDIRARHGEASSLGVTLGKQSSQQLVGVIVTKKDVAHTTLDEQCLDFFMNIAGPGHVKRCEPAVASLSGTSRTNDAQLGLFPQSR